MIAAQFHLDVLGELEKFLPSYRLCVPSFVIRELEAIKKRSKGKKRTSAAVALKIACSSPIIILDIPLLEKELVDDALIRISSVLCTNDRDLRRKARDEKIPVVYLRQKRYMAVDGHLDL
jgi:uncharacterized protein